MVVAACQNSWFSWNHLEEPLWFKRELLSIIYWEAVVAFFSVKLSSSCQYYSYTAVLCKALLLGAFASTMMMKWQVLKCSDITIKTIYSSPYGLLLWIRCHNLKQTPWFLMSLCGLAALLFHYVMSRWFIARWWYYQSARQTPSGIICTGLSCFLHLCSAHRTILDLIRFCRNGSQQSRIS